MSNENNFLPALGGISSAGAGAGAAIATALGIATLPASAIGAGVCLVVFGIIKVVRN